MTKSNLLPDEFYDKQVNRLSGLDKFPRLPAAQLEMRRALRRISETDKDFLFRLISDVVDTHTSCPTPAELIQMAGQQRHIARKPMGSADCELCHGSGFVSFTKRVEISGVAPYDADFTKVCPCRGGH